MLNDEIASQQRHARFVQQAVAVGDIWGLKNAAGWCVGAWMNEGNEEHTVMPFWSDRASAKQCAKDDWSGYVPTVIPLQEFMEEWLPGLAEDGLFVGTNWDTDLAGVELEPMTLGEELAQALRKKAAPANEPAAD